MGRKVGDEEGTVKEKEGRGDILEAGLVKEAHDVVVVGVGISWKDVSGGGARDGGSVRCPLG